MKRHALLLTLLGLLLMTTAKAQDRLDRSSIEVINDMESMLQFTAKDEEWGKASTIGDFVDVIERHI